MFHLQWMLGLHPPSVWWRGGDQVETLSTAKVERWRLFPSKILAPSQQRASQGSEHIQDLILCSQKSSNFVTQKIFKPSFRYKSHLHETFKKFYPFFRTSARVLWKYCSCILLQYFPNTLAEVSSLLRLKTTSRCQQRRIKFWRRRCL